jgi:hypothetical protein
MKFWALITNTVVIGVISYGFFHLGWRSRGIPHLLLALLIMGNLFLWAVLGGRAKRKRAGLEGVERRSSLRVIYPPGTGPHLQVADQSFPVADISQRGLRLINDRDVRMARPVRGTLTFSDGQKVDISGTIEWQKAEKISLLLEERIPLAIISKEFHQLGESHRQ